jgi:RHS repeat-associated protein
MATDDNRAAEAGAPETPSRGGGTHLLSQMQNAPRGTPADGTTTDTDDAPSVPTLPSPTLPKGGGALRGLGETYQVNSANGTFGATIPMRVSPARGFEPDLTLRYDSGSGNGLYGEGWSLDLGSVMRKTDKVLPRYHDQDIFLAGGEDLVPALTPDGGAWAQGTRDVGTHSVQCFLPRVEAAYDRVERWTRKSDRDVHWRVRTASGRTNVYGESRDARVADPADATRVYRWLIERSYDDRGNLIHYRYRAEDRANVAATIWEQHRAIAYTLPDRVCYGVRAPYDPAQSVPDDPSAYLFEIVFDYGERDGIAGGARPPYLPPASWSARADAFSSFKAGFDVRCYRLCKRVLMFHRIEEAGTDPVLVHETRLRYDGDRSLAKLLGVTAIGWRDGTQLAFPEARFGYTEARVDPTVHKIDLASAQNLPAPVDGSRAQWVDLDGEGIPGALIEDRPGWFYKRNLGAGALAPVEALRTRPSLELAEGGQLLDVAGDGTKSLVRFGAPAPGVFARTDDFDWAPFAPFSSLPTVEFKDPNLRFIDLDGDGRSDLLITEDRVLRWYSSRGHDGFSPAELAPKPTDEERGPALVFADAEQAIYLADMTGDGLTDLVRIRNGEVCYWPNLGYGRFGAKVTMANAPRFTSAYEFKQSHVRLADVDGSGTSDLLYGDGDRVRYWLNLAGNQFGETQFIAGLSDDSSSRLDTVDLLGDGTSCLVWTSPLPRHERQALRYVSLTGGVKPHLLQTIDTGLGRSVRVDYAASTKFYLRDRAAGNALATRVPFPVQVVERVTTTDQVSGGVLSAEYSYRHGFYDGTEREFRGFGMVEQRDTQTLATLESQGLFPAGVDYVPPARTRTWFHTGAFLDGDELTVRFQREWFSLDADQARLDGGLMPDGLDAEEWREALRALRGKPLRVETYADESPATPATPIPYHVVEHNYQVRAIQARGANWHGVFVADPLETLRYHYERNAADPRVEHELVLSVGRYGAVEKRLRVGYPSRSASIGLIASYSEHDSFARDDEAEVYRVNVVAETRLYEVMGLHAPTFSPFVFARAQLQLTASLAGTADDLGFDETASPARTQRRLVRRTQLQYLGDDDATPATVGSFGRRALLCQTQHAVLPETMAGTLLPAAIDATAMQAAGYVQHDNHWWAPSAAIAYLQASFFQPARFTDPFTHVSRVVYDEFQLSPAQVINALNHTVSATYDYLALQPSRVTDVNGNSTLAAYDALGRLTNSAKTGKAGEGDTLFAPTTHYDYAITNWRDHSAPNYTYTKQRQVHGADDFQERYVYTDGFGRELQTKVKADPGGALAVQGGVLVNVNTNDRWLASGRTVYDNKGNAVRRYEPFYAVGAGYEANPLLAFLGVTSVLRYDPMGRVVRIDRPDGSFSTVAIGAWEVRESDGSDNVDEEGKLWATRPGQTAADQRAVIAARRHRRTPTRHVSDALGRRVSTFVDNTQQDLVADAPDNAHVLYETRRVLDIEGRPLEIHDDRGLRAATPYATLQQAFDMMGRVLRATGADTGISYSLQDCQSKPFYVRDARGVELRLSYDALRRPTDTDANDTARGVSWTAEKTIYGDDPVNAPVDPTANLLGRVYQSFDQAGISTSARYDFKGNALEQSHQLIGAYSGAPDWTRTYLEPFRTGLQYDALDRVTQVTLPRRNLSAGADNVITRAYLSHGPLSKLTLQSQYGASVDVVSQIEYDPKGRRVSANYGNGAARTYTYDPITFRLAAMSATRNGGTQTLQQIAYTYDASGNLTEVNDVAQATVFNNNQKIDARMSYSYDSIYRLTDATGRELRNPTQPAAAEQPFAGWTPDGNDLVNYLEHYDYDTAGNLSQIRHSANHGITQWTRRYGYDPQSNRLTGTSLPGAPDPTVLGASYGYDLAGNITSMPHLAAICWDERGRLASADRLGGGIVYNRYGSTGQRARKVLARATGGGETITTERIYLGEYEVYRELDAGGVATKELETLHGLDGASRVVLVETDTTRASPASVHRYQLDNHLGSAITELDDHAALLSYEEYHPFGTTAYQARASIAEVSLKRYRFIGKERDSETGFYYCDARHYCAWLGRWVNPDPKGIAGGLDLYVYSKDNPIGLRDPSGQDPNPPATGEGTIPVGPLRVHVDARAFRLPRWRPHVPIVPDVPPDAIARWLHPTPSTSERPQPSLHITDVFPHWPFPEPPEPPPPRTTGPEPPEPTEAPITPRGAQELQPKGDLDFQASWSSGYDISNFTPVIVNLQLGWPNVTLNRRWGHNWDPIGSSHHQVNYFSGPSLVFNWQQLGNTRGLAPDSANPVYRQQGGIGAQINTVDVQFRTRWNRPILDLQLPIQMLGQIIGDPFPGGLDPSSHRIPSTTGGAQATTGVNLDFHLGSHTSILVGVGVGVGWNPVNGFGPAFSATLGFGTHSQDQLQP